MAGYDLPSSDLAVILIPSSQLIILCSIREFHILKVISRFVDSGFAILSPEFTDSIAFLRYEFPVEILSASKFFNTIPNSCCRYLNSPSDLFVLSLSWYCFNSVAVFAGFAIASKL